MDEGLDVSCVERTQHIGGLWRYTENSKDGQGCVAKSTVINTSKEFTAFSDYPMLPEYANYMHNTKLMEYFTNYSNHFKIQDKIRFEIEVINVNRASDFDETGKWDVKMKNLKVIIIILLLLILVISYNFYYSARRYILIYIN